MAQSLYARLQTVERKLDNLTDIADRLIAGQANMLLILAQIQEREAAILQAVTEQPEPELVLTLDKPIPQ